MTGLWGRLFANSCLTWPERKWHRQTRQQQNTLKFAFVTAFSINKTLEKVEVQHSPNLTKKERTLIAAFICVTFCQNCISLLTSKKAQFVLLANFMDTYWNISHMMRVMKGNNGSLRCHVVHIYRENLFHCLVTTLLVSLQAHLGVWRRTIQPFHSSDPTITPIQDGDKSNCSQWKQRERQKWTQYETMDSDGKKYYTV